MRCYSYTGLTKVLIETGEGYPVVEAPKHTCICVLYDQEGCIKLNVNPLRLEVEAVIKAYVTQSSVTGMYVHALGGKIIAYLQ